MKAHNKIVCALSEKEISYFYNLLFRYEQEYCQNPNGFDIRRADVFIKNNHITLVYNNKKKKSFVIKDHNKTNTIMFKHTKNSVPMSLIYHVRNAFAHGQIIDKGTNYVLYDIYGKKDNYTMYGVIRKELLQNLINLLEDNKREN